MVVIITVDNTYLTDVFNQYKTRENLLYQTWFIKSEKRLRAFKRVRKYVQLFIKHVNNGTFPTDFKNSALEDIMDVIAEQTEIFKGAKHAFMWKPKLRIPDIYENRENQLAFSHCLDQILKANQEIKMLLTVNILTEKKIRGLGPAVANILYFLEPTIFPPFNTAIVNGYNYLTGSKIRLGKWEDYFKLRDGMIELNCRGGQFSKDLGAISAFLFDIGKLNYIVRENEEEYIRISESNTQKLIKKKLEKEDSKNVHQKIQYILATLGNEIGYHAWIASNDHNRMVDGNRLGDVSLPLLPETIYQLPISLSRTIGLIDVIWFSKNGEPVCAFEVEKSTSIISGMNRMDDLYSIHQENLMMYIVSPNQREEEIRAQFNRPHYMRNQNLHDHLRYILFTDLEKHANFMKKFGKDFTILAPISHYPSGELVR